MFESRGRRMRRHRTTRYTGGRPRQQAEGEHCLEWPNHGASHGPMADPYAGMNPVSPRDCSSGTESSAVIFMTRPRLAPAASRARRRPGQWLSVLRGLA